MNIKVSWQVELIFFLLARRSLVGQGLLIAQPSRLLSDTSHPAGNLWTSDQQEAETSTRQHTTLTRDR